MAEREKKSGIYIHIPFCHSKCTYCSFITGSYEELLVENYISALEAEIRRKAASLLPSQKFVDTIYFGGGTPSIISPKQLERLLSTCLESFHVCQKTEITAEMNPSDLQKSRLEAFRQIGINRASVGIQSFIDLQLKAIGRDHSAEQALTAIEKLHASGFDNISIDLIAGLPDQTWQQWSYNLSTAFSMLPDHLSIYLLEIKEATTLYAQVKSGRVATPDQDLAAQI
ncbi:MAG: coproporphyrinogen III oxidase family protein [Blastocatellia bacterium]|nr:coproporphyrinogen III oxidase family protein [Blastocatellia bacterium]